MLDVRLKVPYDELRRTRDLLQHVPQGAERATARAMNRTLEGARTEVVRSVTSTYIIRAADVRETITIDKASADKLQARLRSQGAVIGLQHFQHSPKAATNPRPKVGIRVRVRKDSRASALPGTFIAGGRIGIFQRAGRDRLPLERRFGPAVPSMVGTVVEEQQIERQAGDRFIRELNHEIDYLLTKGKR